MNSATENSTTSTRTETRTSLDQGLLLKVLSNPEMAKKGHFDGKTIIPFAAR